MARRSTPITKSASARDAEVGKAGGGPMFAEIGVSGLKRWGGYVDEEFLKELRGQRAIKTYREMRDNDDIVGAILFAFENLAKQIEWRIDPGAEDDEAAERAEFVRTCLFEDMSASWQDTLSEILTFLPYGWAWMEVVFKIRGGDVSDATKRSKYDDGRIGWRKWALRSQDSLQEWIFDEHGGIQALKQIPPPDYTIRTIPISKSLLFRTSAQKNNPEGRSVLRNAYRSWYFKKNIQVVEGIGIERDLAGYPYITVAEGCPIDVWNPNDPNAATMKSTLEKVVRSIRRDEQEGALLPWWCKLELLSAGSRRQFDTSAIINRYDQRIAMTMLADFILLGHEAVGSKALSVSKIDLFCAAMGGFLDSISAVVNKHAIPKLLRLNGLPLDNAPMLVHGKVERIDLGMLGDFLQKLSAAGASIFPNAEAEKHLLTVAGVPAPAEEGGTVGDDPDEDPDKTTDNRDETAAGGQAARPTDNAGGAGDADTGDAGGETDTGAGAKARREAGTKKRSRRTK